MPKSMHEFTIKEGFTLSQLREFVIATASLPGDVRVKSFAKLNGDLKTLRLSVNNDENT